jgi:hypothetical protein
MHTKHTLQDLLLSTIIHVYSTRTEEYYIGWVAFGPGAGGPGAVGTEATGQPQHDSHFVKLTRWWWSLRMRRGGRCCRRG